MAAQRNSLLIVLFLGILFANPCLAERYDGVSSVTIGGIELSREITKEQFDKLFVSAAIIQEQVYSQCTANYEVSFAAGKITGMLEFYPERNSAEAPHENGLLWLEIEDFDALASPIYVGKIKIRQNMSFSEFKKHFPVSAGSASTEPHEPKAKFYHVLIDGQHKIDSDVDGLPYIATVKFLFIDNQLKKVYLSPGIAC